MRLRPSKMWLGSKLASEPTTSDHFQDVIQVRMLQDLAKATAGSPMISVQISERQPREQQATSKKKKKTKTTKNDDDDDDERRRNKHKRQVEEEKSLSRGLLILFSMILLFDAKPCDSATLADLALRNQVVVSRSSLEPAGDVDSPLVPPDVDQEFKANADRNVLLHEGETILLKCVVANLQGKGQWRKDSLVIYDQELGADFNENKHYVVNGNTALGDFSLELRNARLDDTAQYTCRIRPKLDLPIYKELEHITNLTVRSREPQPADTRTTESLLLPAKLAGSPETKQARDVLGNLPKLGGSGAHLSGSFITPAHHSSPNSLAVLQPSSQYQVNHHHLSPQGSTQHHGQSAPSTASSILLLWPYLLLGLAGILFMANIYLICSLYRRHKRAQAHRRRHSNQVEGSLESSSNAGCSSSNLGDENDSQARLKNLSR